MGVRSLRWGRYSSVSLSDASADDDQFWGEDELEFGKVALQPNAIFLPAESVAFPGERGGFDLGVEAVYGKVAMLGVGTS
jgi:hypothetical protein